MIRLILWLIIFGMFMRIFRRPSWYTARRPYRPFGGDPDPREREDILQTARQSEERFELKKRHAMEAGSMGYIWHTSNDGQCPQHKSLEGRFVPWNNPPVIDGRPAHAGESPDCSCIAEIVR